MEITREQFEQQRHPRFGIANPERMTVPFWDWMIRGDDCPPPDDGRVLSEFRLVMREGMLKSSYGPWRARDLFDAPPSHLKGPVWTFDRMGQTRTELPDGRVVCVAGEHEDSYDPDFHIYNDVLVFNPSDEVEIYGYPRDVFPPTDFHTASLDGNRLVMIGCMGYRADRRPGHTPVYALNLTTYRVDRLDTTGETPGWINRHEAEFDADRRVVTVRGGEVLIERDDGRWFRPNVEEYELDLRTLSWRQTTNRNWPQFSIRPSDGKWFGMNDRPDFENFCPLNIPCEWLIREEWNCHRLVIEGKTVKITVAMGAVEILIEGTLVADLLARLIEAAKQHIEAACHRPCVVDAY